MLPWAVAKQAHVADAVVDVSCGEGEQKARWLAHVAIARYDAVASKGYMQLGTGWLVRA